MLNANKEIILGSTTQTSQGCKAFFLAASIHQVTRRLWHEHHHTSSKDKSGENLDTDWDQPCSI
jgi:hypothetical protein